ncbi:MAG: MmgE/PrpD family protein, partial [Pseudomonadota bacterium]
LQPVLDQLGVIWRIEEVSHKPFPTGRAAQGGIVALKRLSEKIESIDEITDVKLSAPPLIKRLVGRPHKEGMTANYARLCFQFIGAHALLRKYVGLKTFLPDALSDPEVAALASKITVVENSETDPAAFTPQTAEISLVSGETISITINALYGSPGDQMEKKDYEAKFKECLGFAGSSASPGEVISTVYKLPDLADATEFLDTLYK